MYQVWKKYCEQGTVISSYQRRIQRRLRSRCTIQRAGTLVLYARKLDDLYARLDRVRAENDELVRPGGGDEVSVVTEYIRNVLISVTGWDEDRVSNQDNFFHLGFASLHAIAAALQLKCGLDILDITPNIIYQNPSVSGLADAVTQYQHNQGTQEAPDKNSSKKDPRCYKSSSGISTTIRLLARSLATALKDIPFSSQALPVPSEHISSIPCYKTLLSRTSTALPGLTTAKMSNFNGTFNSAQTLRSLRLASASTLQGYLSQIWPYRGKHS
ncbi:hypothetical protein BJX65DRAFT_128386 [Aspergillus insuetus]